MAEQSWEKTAIWARLQEMTEANETRHYVESWLKEVDQILAKASTSPLDFTLHDDDHSYRVAECIFKLIPKAAAEKISDYEWALLLKSAYLHDIGMNPRREILQQVREFLMSGSSPDGLEEEKDLLIQWLDEVEPGAQPPIFPELESHERIEKAEYLTAYYARHRHNDWSEQYMRSLEQSKGRPPYPTWIDDLIALCKSHHFGYDQLMKQKFDIRIAGSGNRLVNLRYLAALLRVADVLEFDPERTPSVVFRHRNIGKNSIVFWHKDETITLGIDQEQHEILFTARTKNAWLHKAVLETADAVDVELQTCVQINQKDGFKRGVILQSPDYYSWPWPMNMRRDIVPEEDTFVYIDGAFRPESGRLIELLAGTRLYHNKLAAVRELLQNAFDAVREKIAWNLVARTAADVDVDSTMRALEEVHQIDLFFETVHERVWLVCEDTGVGMTRNVIERQLLVSGSKPRPELLHLQRICASKGIDFYRCGEFGIGVLSYFMIADKLIIETKADPEAHSDVYHHAWRFETNGLDDFGELRPIQRHSGTTVRLRMKEPFQEKDMRDLIEYSKSILARLPCKVNIFIKNEQGIALSPGWTSDNSMLRKLCLSRIRNYADHSTRKLLSNKRIKEIESEKAQWALLHEKACKSIRFLEPEIFKLSPSKGSARAHKPYFEFQGKPCPIFIDVNDDIIRALPSGEFGKSIYNHEILSWRGFRPSRQFNSKNRFSSDLDSSSGGILEIDLTLGASISVDREHINYEDKLPLKVVNEHIELLDNNFAKLLSTSPYAVLAGKNALASIQNSDHLNFWAFPEELHEGEPVSWRWRQVKFPAVLTAQRVREFFGLLGSRNLKRINAVDELRPLNIESKSDLFPLPKLKASRLVVARKYKTYFPLLVFESHETLREDSRQSVKFPEEWNELLCYVDENMLVFNENHLIYQSVTSADWQAFIKIRDKADGPESFLKDVTALGATFAAAFLLDNASSLTEYWNALRDRLPNDYEKIFNQVLQKKCTGFKILVCGFSGGLRNVDGTGATFKDFHMSNSDLLPELTEGYVDIKYME